MKKPTNSQIIIGLLVFLLIIQLITAAALIGSMQQLYRGVTTLTEFTANSILNPPKQHNDVLKQQQQLQPPAQTPQPKQPERRAGNQLKHNNTLVEAERGSINTGPFLEEVKDNALSI